MSYILKIHFSGDMLRSVSLKSNISNGTPVCSYCLKNHKNMPHDVRLLSTYVSALKLILKRKAENGKKIDMKFCKTAKNSAENEDSHTQVEYFKNVLNASKDRKTKIKILQLKPWDVAAFATNPSMTVEKFKKHKYFNFRADEVSNNDVKTKSHLNSSQEYFRKKNETKKILKTAFEPRGNFILSKTPSESVNSNKKVNYEKINLKNSKIITGKSDIINILPSSSVKVFPMPKNFQDHIVRNTRTGLNSLPRFDGHKKNHQVLEQDPKFQAKTQNLCLQDNVQDSDKLNFDVEENYCSWFGNMDANLEDSCQKGDSQDEYIDPTSQKYLYLKSLHSYVDVSINSNLSEDALNLIKNCRKKALWKDVTKMLYIVEVYNQLLFSFSGHCERVKDIQKMMEYDGIKFNYQSYAALIDNLGKVKNEYLKEEQWKNEIIEILTKTQTLKHSLNGLFYKTVLTKDQRQNILCTIRQVLPYFEIPPSKIKLNSNCNLLKDLNESNKQLESRIGNVLMNETIDTLVGEQLEMEKKFFIPVEAIKLNENYSDKSVYKNKLDLLNSKWKAALEEGFFIDLKAVEMEYLKNKNKINIYPYLKCLPVDKYINAMMHTIQSLVEYSGSYSPNTSTLYRQLGEIIHKWYGIMKKQKSGIVANTETLFKKYCEWYNDPTGPARNSRQEWQMIIEEYSDGHPIDMKEIYWPDPVKVELGKFLYSIILKRVKVNLGQSSEDELECNIPVFYLVMRRKIDNCSEEIKCHPIVGKLFQKCGFNIINFEISQIPMLCPPKPWKSSFHGGYLISSVSFIREPGEPGGKKLDFRKIHPQQLYATFDALNTLQNTPWTVNEPVLDVVLEVFRNGGSEELDVPVFPSTEPLVINRKPGQTREELIEEYTKRKTLLMERQNQYGLWCEAMYRLTLANHFRNREFWLPQNFDFRGRVYPVPPHLNHIGSDLFRSLLIFAKGKPLGPKGFDWLKIHTINLTGTHKRKSNRERLNYANEIMDEILDSAERPLTGRKWWTKSDEPWQTLGACMEIKKALEYENPEHYVSRFPVHQDGSCNGLQHYAALGRDSIGAKSVNLTPSEAPQDIYSFVTQIIEKERIIDANNGVEIAKILEGFVLRKVVKQTIMTTVYGVTRYGAKHQIARQLGDMDNFPEEHIWEAAKYLTKKAFLTLQQMFTSAKEIQDWFTQCASVISSRGDYVQWTSPLGLPILQPYSKKLKSSRQKIKKLPHLLIPNKMKQKNAFPPNFVHSLDSTHMMLTALHCEQANVMFASIHDCFWTHPCHVDIMNRICREQFILLHSQAILENLSKHFCEFYLKENDDDEEAMKIFKGIPTTGDFDVTSVLNSVYFFS